MKNIFKSCAIILIILVLGFQVFASNEYPTKIVLSQNQQVSCPAECQTGEFNFDKMDFEPAPVDCGHSNSLPDCCQPTGGINFCRLARCGGCITGLVPEVDVSGSCYDYCANRVLEQHFPKCMQICTCSKYRLTYAQCSDVSVLFTEKLNQVKGNLGLLPGACFQGEGTSCGYGKSSTGLTSEMDAHCTSYLGRTVSACPVYVKYTCQ